MHKTVAILLMFVGAILGLLFLLNLLSLSTSLPRWIADGDWLSLSKRVLATFIVGALAFKAWAAGRRGLLDNELDSETREPSE